jgi:hypothetical protein
MPDDKPTFTPEDLSHIPDDGGASGDAGADKGAAAPADAPADQGKDDKATANTGGEAGKKPEAASADPKAGEANADADADGLLGDEDDDGEGAETGTEGDKTAKAEGKDEPDPSAWRVDAVKAAERKWLAKAKTDDEKKAAAERVERMKSQLGRYGTLEAAMIALADAQDKLRSRQHAEPLSKDASPEEVAEWREKNGLPKEAKDIAIPRVEVTTETGERKYHEWTEADQPLHDAFREVAYDLKLSQDQVNRLVDWQFKSAQARVAEGQQALKAIDKEDKRHARTFMREEWGAEYDPRIAVVERFIKDEEALPDGAGKLLWEARDAAGHRVAFHPGVMMLLADAAQARYGEGAFLTGDAKETMASEEERILTVMKTDFERYKREGMDVKLMQLRERKAGRSRKAA